ncbi:MAG: hypothetical protein DIZ80_00425 [endosymbiont of Galathealinum brachiosum]|uniref:DUF5675 domain-containing protein n=1 Tax=endosymbiont of Galathealinum brachiosum TaxID=2200906 RepID=A0A370DMB0_9GAMM|nr:MAG: hypothetical protein DIZ80_00425 [endosymbiont of Galathealinum brachiosum]
MSWNFIHVVRRTFQSDDNWGEMFIQNTQGQWEKLCFTYELPWDTFSSGPHTGKSKNNHSRVKIGDYNVKPRADGPKGWRLELQNTGHRSNIQIHRAHKSMFIQGCMLPVSFNNLSTNALNKGDPLIQIQSTTLMTKIKNRYDLLKTGKTGDATLTISATLPAKVNIPGANKYA